MTGSGSGIASGGTTTGNSSGTATGGASGTPSGSSSGPISCPVFDVESSEAGSCGPQVISEYPCNGGEVLFACGLPDNPYQDCASYCGSDLFRCYVATNNGVVDHDYPAPWDDTDAGATPVLVVCFRPLTP